MNRFFWFFGISILLCTACNNHENGEAKTDTAQTNTGRPDAVQPNPVDDEAAKGRVLKQFDALEKLFDNANYLVVQGKDTNYFYFSRVNNYLIKTYSYKMIKGDSADLKIDSIKPDATNNVEWNRGGEKLALKNNTDFQAIWNVVGADSVSYEFQKAGNNTIQYLRSDGKRITLKKTITLSTFLVRSFYDYTHGTKLAFDSTNFTKKRKSN